LPPRRFSNRRAEGYSLRAPNPRFRAHLEHRIRTSLGRDPVHHDELVFLFDFFAMSGALETSVLAYRDGQPVGALMVTPSNRRAQFSSPAASWAITKS